jgi:tRNA A37 threonylcarbamoyladenosine synthetase subunit TsaC/SUA5/YrdC
MAVFQIKQPSSRQGVTQALAVGAASAALPNAFGSDTFQVRLSATAACFYLITESASPVAATDANAAYLPSGIVEYVTVTPGQKLTAIQATASGTLTVTEVS